MLNLHRDYQKHTSEAPPAILQDILRNARLTIRFTCASPADNAIELYSFICVLLERIFSRILKTAGGTRLNEACR